MTHVQLSGDVRRRDHDGIGLLLRVHMGREASAVVPHFIDAVFKVFRLVRFRQFLFHKVRSFPFRSPIKKAPAILQNCSGRISREIFRLLSVLPPEFGNDLAALILHGYGCEPAQTTHFRPHGNFPCAAPRLPSPTLSENLHRPFSLCQNQRRDTPPLLCISCFL